MRIFIIGGSGGVGREFTARAVERGHAVTAQTRRQGSIAAAEGVTEAVGQPTDRAFLATAMAAHDAVVSVLGIDHRRPTTLFSDAARATIAAMEDADVARLIAVSGIGTGETRGHGGWLYNRIIFPLFTRNRYADKERQEALIEASGLDWTIVRPAPFVSQAPAEPPEVLLTIPNGVQLRAITRAETARFLLDTLEENAFLREKPFIGHRRRG